MLYLFLVFLLGLILQFCCLCLTLLMPRTPQVIQLEQLFPTKSCHSEMSYPSTLPHASFKDAKAAISFGPGLVFAQILSIASYRSSSTSACELY